MTTPKPAPEDCEDCGGEGFFEDCWSYGPNEGHYTRQIGCETCGAHMPQERDDPPEDE